MDKHKSNIMELMECLDSIDKTDFQEMSRKFKNDSLLLSGSAMTFGTVFLLLELIKEIKEIKNFLYDKNNSKGKSDINPVINISTSLKEENLKVEELSSKMKNFLDKSMDDTPEEPKEEVKSEENKQPLKKTVGKPALKKKTPTSKKKTN